MTPDAPVQITHEDTTMALITQETSVASITHDSPVLETFLDAPLASDGEVSKKTTRKRKTSPLVCSTQKKAKTKLSVRKPWSLLIDGERRLKSLRSSSCDSGSDSQAKPTSSAEEQKDSVIDSGESEVPKNEPTTEPTSATKKTQDLIQTRGMSRNSSCDSGAENSQSQTPPINHPKSENDRRALPKVSVDSLLEKSKLSVLATKSPSQRNSSHEAGAEIEQSSSTLIEKPSVALNNARRMSLRSSSCDSGNEPSQNPKASTKQRQRPSSGEQTNESLNSNSLPRKKKTTKVQELKESESDSGPNRMRRRVSKVVPIKPLSDDSEVDKVSNDKSVSRAVSSEDSEAPLATVRRPRNAANKRKQGSSLKNESLKKIVKKKTTSKILDSDSESDEARDDPNSTRNLELKSRLSPIDFNSKPKSRIFIRNDYLNSSDKQSKSQTTDLSLMMKKLSSSITKRKADDATYTESPVFQKRERLRTSAFKGNHECSSDEDIDSEPDTRRSVSRGQSVDSEPQAKPAEIKRGRPKKAEIDLCDVKKKEFAQEPLEKAKEDQVPYDAILESIKFSVKAEKGRALKKVTEEYEAKKEKDRQALQALKYFQCGSCHFKVTKHKWIDHFVEHGGIAWIEGFEAPIKLDDWNEAIRRSMKNYKIYDLFIMTCPNCQQEKRSALGHLSHLLVCGESKEAIERKKVQCELCNESFLPFLGTAHRTKCSAYKKVLEPNDGDDEVESSDNEIEDSTPELFNSSGRTKRQAVKR